MPPGKTAVMVLTQANPDPDKFNDIFPRYERWLKIFGCDPDPPPPGHRRPGSRRGRLPDRGPGCGRRPGPGVGAIIILS